ncbi:MAG: serine/threonine-protein kinase, partial [Planctomycetaceae bacterium]
FQLRCDVRLESSEGGVGRPSGVRDRSNGRWRVIRPHAKGGRGEGFVARDTELNREVALKEIQRKYSDLEESRSRFLLEAEVTGALEHPGIVPVYGLGQYADGRPFYAMRFIKGDSLNEAIARFHRQHAGAGELTTGEVGVEFRKLLGRFIDVCEAIEYAHSRGVLHRDLKPGNIMLGKYGETLVVDWGLAKVVGRDERYRQEGETTIAPDQGSGSAPTQGAIGTPVYMSPEQAAGRVADLGPATDVYSLGATLYHVLTGRAPFFGNTTEEILRRVQAGDYVKPRALLSQPNSRETKSQLPGAATARGIPPSLEAICVKAMSLRQEDRYASAAALAADVERFLADEPVSAMKEPVIERARRWVKRHRTLVASTAAAVVMATLGVTILAAVVVGMNAELAAANIRIGQQSEQIGSQLAALEATNNELQLATQAERDAKIEADAKRVLAEQNEQLARLKTEESRRNLYLANMTLAQTNWNAGRVVPVRDLLRKYSADTANADLRGFEWWHLDHLAHMFLEEKNEHTAAVTSVA